MMRTLASLINDDFCQKDTDKKFILIVHYNVL